MTTPLQTLLVMVARRVNQHQRTVIAYLQEEKRVLKELHGRMRLPFNDGQGRRLAAEW